MGTKRFSIRDHKDEDWYKELEGKHPEFLRKFEQDEELTDEHKHSLTKELSDSGNSDNIESVCKKFCHNNQLLGSECKNEIIGPLVRIKDKERFVTWIEINVGANDIENILDEILDGSNPEDVKKLYFESLLALKVENNVSGFSLKDFQVDPNISWSFTDPREKSGSDLKGKDIQDWDCRAGLSENKDKDKVVFLQDISKLNKLCKPTIFDAEFYSQFEPGGTTRPLPECNESDGFEEFVHKPVKFSQLNSLCKITK